MISVTAIWTILEGKKSEVMPALEALASKVQATELGTLLYIPQSINTKGYSDPKPNPNDIVFVEMYKDQAAFDFHLYGPNGQSDPSGTFVDFVNDYGHLFEWNKTADMPKMVVTALNAFTGFVREGMDFPCK
jgi:quinol monooxygenase YgiN